MNDRWHAARSALAAVAWGSILLAAPAPGASLALTPSIAQAQQAIEDGDEDLAVGMLREIVAARPDDPQAWFLYGYALHACGQIEEAVKAHEKAASFEGSPFRAVALYNEGCAHALLGQRNEAFEALNASVAAGMTDADQIRKDPDLKNLRRDERWQKLLDRIEHPAGPAGSLHFWVGEWDCYDQSGALNGHNTLALRVNDKVIHESWTPEGAGSKGESWNWFDPSAGAWHQVWVDATGLSTHFVGTPKDGGILFEGTRVSPDGTTALVRMFVRPTEGGRVQQTGTQSDDEGQTWSPRYDLTYVPKGQAFTQADGEG